MASDSLNVLAVSAGVGGLELALKLALGTPRLVGAVEIEAAAAAILAARMDEGALDDAPIWSDARTFPGRRFRGCVDIVAAGYPCQPESVAGKRLGRDDPRYLWPDVRRVIVQTGCWGVFIENVDAHLTGTYWKTRRDLLRLGFEIEEGLWTAAEARASQLRTRLFVLAIRRCDGLAVTDGGGFERCTQSHIGQKVRQPTPRRGDAQRRGDDLGGRGAGQACTDGARSQGIEREGDGCAAGPSTAAGLRSGTVVADTARERRREGRPAAELRGGRDAAAGAGGALVHDDDGGHYGRPHEPQRRSIERSDDQRASRSALALPYAPPGPKDYAGWIDVIDRAGEAFVPALCRMADGMAGRVDRLRACGNGVHPLAGALAFRTLAARLAARGNARAAALLSRSDEWLRNV